MPVKIDIVNGVLTKLNLCRGNIEFTHESVTVSMSAFSSVLNKIREKDSSICGTVYQ